MSDIKVTKRQVLAMLASNQIDAAIAAGYSLSAAIAAGYSLSDARAAGYSLSDARAAGYSNDQIPGLVNMIAEAPLVLNPYSKMLAQISEGQRHHDQSTFGPDCDPAANLCKTPMCTAGHLVNMAGQSGYELKKKYGWSLAATLIHERAHPGWPCQNFGAINQEWAMAYIEEMAEREELEQSVKP